MFKKTIELPFEIINRVTSWEEFEVQLRNLDSSLHKLKENKSITFVSPPLFRGQSDYQWRLETTLDRATKHNSYLVREYINIVRISSEIMREKYPRTFPSPPKKEQITSPEGFEQTEAMAYLRHHGFPSPLLDWTSKVDVAAYFAFWDPCPSDFVSIYVLIEYFGIGKTINPRMPYIHSVGHHLNAHMRHNNQGSEYTMCLIKKDGEYCYAQHELALNFDNKAQDIVLKFEIPAMERMKVLRSLESKGITTSFLMGQSEDSVCKDLAFSLLFSKT